MSESKEAFTRLLRTIPKVEHGPKFSTDSLYQEFYTQEKPLIIEGILSPFFLNSIELASSRQDQYNLLYAKYKQISNLTQELFQLKNQ